MRSDDGNSLVLLVAAVLGGLGHSSSVGTSASIVAPALSVQSSGLVHRAQGLHVADRDLRGRISFKDASATVRRGRVMCHAGSNKS